MKWGNDMYETSIRQTGELEGDYFVVRVPGFGSSSIKMAQGIALQNGYDPSRPAKMTTNSTGDMYYAFRNNHVKTLFNGKRCFKIHACNDLNGNKLCKAFYIDGTSELIKNAQMPISVDKMYKSISGLYRSTW